jgi:hypothetical protein
MDSGKDTQIKAAAELVVQFAKSQGFVPTPATLLNTGASTSFAGQGLSKEDFQSELRKLSPQSRDFEAKRGELFSRRQVGKQVGM